MALTATATKTLRRDVARIIDMSDELVVSRLPVKSNVMYVVVPFSSIQQTFSSLAKTLQEKITTCPRMIQVIHYGAPNNIESYIQQTGRAGHDSLPALAIFVKKAGRKRYVAKSMTEYLK